MWLDRCIYEYKLVPKMQGALDITYYFVLAYSMYFQFFTQVAIACNRFTAISFPMRHSRVKHSVRYLPMVGVNFQLWKGRAFIVALFLVFIVPFLCASSRLILALATGGDWWPMWGWAEHVSPWMSDVWEGLNAFSTE